MTKIATHRSEKGTIIRWESLWDEIEINERRIVFYYGVLPLYQERGQPLREKTGDCSFEEYLNGDLNNKVEKAFGKKTVEEVRQSVIEIDRSTQS